VKVTVSSASLLKLSQSMFCIGTGTKFRGDTKQRVLNRRRKD